MSRDSDHARLRAPKNSHSAARPRLEGDALRSIAHDFNNLIGVIHGYVELLGISELDPAQRRHVDAIRTAAEETGHLAQQISDCADALDGRRTSVAHAVRREPSRDVFDLASTYVGLEARGGAAARIEVTPKFWDAIEARPDLREGRLVALFQMTADWDHWEMHPNGDEVLVLVSGAMGFMFDERGTERLVELGRGQACIVPRGTWHRAIVQEPSALLAITAGRGTEHRRVR